MYEAVRTQIQARLIVHYSPEMVKDILSVMDRVMLDYDVTKKETSLVLYESSLQEAARMYLLCRKAEGVADGSLQNMAYTLKRFTEQVNKPL